MATLPMRTDCRLAGSALAPWTEGRWIGEAPSAILGVCLDSRAVAPGDLFVALSGATSDGHLFIRDAAARGAAAALVSSSGEASALPCLRVADTLVALHAIASHCRARYDGLMAALTGSVGKTTVKDMTAAILSVLGPTLATEGNFNNATGVPLTLLALASHHQFAVVEIGMSLPGEISSLVPLVRPDIAAVINVKPVHLQNFTSLADIAAAKAEILTGIRPGGIAVLNADDSLVRAMRVPDAVRAVWFGRDSTSDLCLTSFGCVDVDRQHFTLRWRDREIEVTLGVPGDHNRFNAAAAAAIALAAGAGPDDVAAGLSQFTPSPMRSRLVHLTDGSILLEDCYNASPDAFAAALHTIVHLPVEGRRVVVMGDMRELGDAAEVFHREVGARAAVAGIAELLAYGPLAEAAVREFQRASPGGTGYYCTTSEELVQHLLASHRPGDIILIKGSRAMALERVSAALLAQFPPRAQPGPSASPNPSS
ncbi:UDP-N-acetylmuramoyl-tripeptide--D-alanyl-D-alanine ligase [Candidatus Fermentibacteria bacterium]|nr:UDP-N-acetylmuramoyl-tripeptide--D-alanyl-D-alanine ligase [Candidatus Fermentibacteria bacterium]